VTRILPENDAQNILESKCRGVRAAAKKQDRSCSLHLKLTDESGPWLQGGSTMIATSMVSFLFGTLLGQRFNVLALVPAVAAVLALSVGAGFTHPQAAWRIVSMAVASAICLQFGYFAGIALRHFLVPKPSQESSPLVGAKASNHNPVR
jgi:hypothetical protein